MHIPITRPVLDDAELSAIAEVLRSGHLVQGRFVAEFERQVAERCQVANAVAVSNGTSALRVALASLGVGAGDVVVVTPYSWIATANVIELCGATPVFVDIDPRTFNMDPSRLHDELTKRSRTGSLEAVRAVMPVHTFGNPAQIVDIVEIASAFSIPVVEDAACALGAVAGGQAAGSFGTVGCFSFHPRKIVTTGEGGMVVTDDHAIAAFARAFRNHGQQSVDGVPEFVLAGDNLRMTDIQGSIGVVQMGRLSQLIEARARLATRYDELLEPLGFTPQQRSAGAAVQAYVALCPSPIDAGDLIADLRDRGVEATIGTSSIPFTRHFA
jgi:dTDP-4-amino-4,6-dideoxygalactose transaminase